MLVLAVSFCLLASIAGAFLPTALPHVDITGPGLFWGEIGNRAFSSTTTHPISTYSGHGAFWNGLTHALAGDPTLPVDERPRIGR